MFSDKSLLWLLSAVNEVKTTRTVERTYREREKKEKRILGRDAGHTVLQLYLIKGTAALI